LKCKCKTYDVGFRKIKLLFLIIILESKPGVIETAKTFFYLISDLIR